MTFHAIAIAIGMLLVGFVLAALNGWVAPPGHISYEPLRIKTTRLPWQFSLRTLLITTTILAVLLGTIVWLAHR